MDRGTTNRADVFAANRAVGHVALGVGAAGGASRRTHVHEAGSLRVRFPTPAAGALEAVLVNTAGGIAGGDRFDIDVAVDANADLVVTTAAAEKIYRSHGPDSTLAVTLAVGTNARLSWLPQETIVFDRARASRSIEVDLAADASLLLCEAVVFGRSAMGEIVDAGRFVDRWRVRRGARLLFADTLRLDGAIAQTLAAPAVARGGIAVATLLVVPGDDTIATAVRAFDAPAGEVGVSAWNGMAVVRFCAPDGAALRHDLLIVLAALGKGPLPRLWLN